MSFTDGNYKAKVQKWGLGKSKEKKTPYVYFSFLPQEKIGGGNCPQFERTVYIYLTEGTIDRAVEILRGLGYKHDTFDQLEPAHADAFDFDGLEIVVRCKHEDYKGELKEKWEFPFSSAPVDPLERKDVSQLNALFASKMKGGNGAKPTKPTGKAATPAPVGAGVSAGDDEEVI